MAYKHLFLGRTLLLRLQGYQTCVGAGMLAPGLANAVSKRYVGAAFGARDVWHPFETFRWPTRKAFVPRTDAAFFRHFGGLLEKHLFLGRTLLLRLQGYQTCGGAGMLAPGLPNAMLVQHLVLGDVCAPFQ